MLKGAHVAGRQIVKEHHLKLRLAAGGRVLEAIGFNMAQGNALAETIDVAFSLEVNSWNGRRRVQLRLRDFREAAA